jgi:hypothetical protein
MQMIIYKTDYITILYHETDKMVETVWHGFASSKDYRANLQQYIEVLKKYAVERWLGDYTKSRVIRPVDQAWTVNEWAPAFMPLTTNIVKMARIKSLDVSAQISSDNIRQDLNTNHLPFQFEDFENHEDARKWLLQV